MAHVLVGCEMSAVVRDAFRARGHEAYSCDLLPCEGDPRWHIQGDILDVIEYESWDIGIFHPPCTFLCNSGVRWLEGGKNKQRMASMCEAAEFFKRLLNAPINRVAVENPVMHKYAREIIGVNFTCSLNHGSTGMEKSSARVCGSVTCLRCCLQMW